MIKNKTCESTGEGQAALLWWPHNWKPLPVVPFASKLLWLSPVGSLLRLILEDFPNVGFEERSRRQRLNWLVQCCSFPAEMTQK